MTQSLATAWPELVRRGPSIVRRVRLTSGLIIFTYVFLHFINHSLGNVSLQAMEQGAVIQEWIWRSRIGTIALYGALAIHFSLAFWALYIRRSIRMGWIEAIRLGLGLTIPLMFLQHALAWRFAFDQFGIHLLYRHALMFYFILRPARGVEQIALFCVAWLHGCIGIYLWLRVKRHFSRVAPFLLVIAVLVPTTALLGIYHGRQQVVEMARSDPAFPKAITQTGLRGHPVARATVNAIENWCWAGYAGALMLLFAARGARALAGHRGGGVRITYPDGRSVRIPKGLSVLDASRRAGIPHASICGGRARCTTCRVRVLLGSERLAPPSPAELRALSPLGVDRAVRLACQLKPASDISIWPLLPPEITMRDRDRIGMAETGAERFVAILFVDIRSSTRLVESRLPYDVVFILNRFFEAVGSAIVAAGGKPNQFIGDGVMAMFGTDTDRAQACRQALEAARLIDWHLPEMNRSLAIEFQQAIAFGVGIHAGEVILGTMGYREHAQMTAIGEAVHVASRLQDLTKEFRCQLVVSDVVGQAAGVPFDNFPAHEVQVRGLSVPLAIRAIDSAAMIALSELSQDEAVFGGGFAAGAAPA